MHRMLFNSAFQVSCILYANYILKDEFNCYSSKILLLFFFTLSPFLL